MKIEQLVEIIGAEFYIGVPDSQLKELCDYLMEIYGFDTQHHIIGANEGNCTALAAGYYMATGKVPVVYMQNSGEGNAINPTTSLLNEKVCGIPIIFIIGWRGEPGFKDEPQHIYQGRITLDLLELMEIKTFIIDKDTTEIDVKSADKEFRKHLANGKSVAFVVRKGALEFASNFKYMNENNMIREDIIQQIVSVSDKDPIICTTGKASRELYEIRETNRQKHFRDFLSVGAMGHASSIALGVAINKPKIKVWCIDGDGAVLMHMGALAVIGSCRPKNMIHIIINNESHESVGGMPTVASNIDFVQIAKACGYSFAICVDNYEALDEVLREAKNKNELSMIEIKCSIGARDDLGRPQISPSKNKCEFMQFLDGLK